MLLNYACIVFTEEDINEMKRQFSLDESYDIGYDDIKQEQRNLKKLNLGR